MLMRRNKTKKAYGNSQTVMLSVVMAQNGLCSAYMRTLEESEIFTTAQETKQHVGRDV